MNNSKISLGKIIFIAVLAVAMILTFIIAFNSISITANKSFKLLGDAGTSAVKASVWMYLGIALGLAGCVTALILSMLGKSDKIVSLIFIASGLLTLIFICISFGVNGDHVKALKDSMKAAEIFKGTDMAIFYKAASLEYYRELIIPIFNLIVFGGVPAAYGVKRLLDKE